MFEMDWATFVATPSRLSAGPVDRAERAALLATASRDGVVTNYRYEGVGARAKKARTRLRLFALLACPLMGLLAR